MLTCIIQYYIFQKTTCILENVIHKYVNIILEMLFPRVKNYVLRIHPEMFVKHQNAEGPRVTKPGTVPFTTKRSK